MKNTKCLSLFHQKDQVDKAIAEYNENHQTHIIHVNTTFELLAQGIQDIITERRILGSDPNILPDI